MQDGELFHGMGEWAWAAGICPLLGPWRYGRGAGASISARAASIPTSSSTFLSSATASRNVFGTPDRDPLDDVDRRRAAPAIPQKFRIVCSAGEPLNPEAIRWFREQYGVTVLDYYGLTESYPLCANFPFMEVREGSMGKPMPGWDVAILDEDERPVAARRARRDLSARAVQPALPARLLEPAGGGHRGGVRRRLVPHQGRGARRTRTATSGTRAAPTT